MSELRPTTTFRFVLVWAAVAVAAAVLALVGLLSAVECANARFPGSPTTAPAAAPATTPASAGG